ncbi:hypothetical protein [Rossellomorea vietnamensis]|jgi:ABC-type oligopeptide transport system substrate-binding subunit|uniref:hypothetical protein n=1 Tax=Rossellomorea vietnamensis TaxID=218284 RepID=UPI001E654781|nr:hypothetical protein [Rossellomorea vietnamensis]MCC5804120.1 hypothetical protein [Rossellomorea vietnamensis]
MKKKFLAGLALMLAFSVAAPLSSSAATYQTWSERGKKYVAYSKNILYWSTNSSGVTSSDPDQTRSGLFIVNKGASKVTSMSDSSRHTYNFKNEFLAGAVLGGVTLGWSDTFLDQTRAYKSGNAYWSYDQ